MKLLLDIIGIILSQLSRRDFLHIGKRGVRDFAFADSTAFRLAKARYEQCQHVRGGRRRDRSEPICKVASGRRSR